ncbi:branched-chain amino acid transport system substrate-binding protein [Bradyrhizobium sp. USDA 4509]|uniref:ABC transporter substrate-binding protein n=1 Tax=Bradyrhizobium brasilense TaxID=1419277 RepID=A0ABY8J6X3_9BRAD|nr:MULTISPECIES: ABC transporter substrate-binding protein [Bradyrhizobium]WFU61300.1 ABC transporter substrate-binding protein [Bradyrhizobium brasilense]
MARKDLTIEALTLTACIVLASTQADAQKKYDPGVSDTEIKIGNIMPYSGPASAYGVIGKASEAYFRMINDQGGINGRKIKFISYDDAYSPPKTVEQARKLVENDEVLLVFQPLGTSGNTAIQKYLNTKKVPQLFVASGATKWGDPKGFPWTMGFQPNYQSEGRIFAKFILEQKPDARIGVLYQNDDFGKDVLKGLKDGLGAKTSLIVAEANYEVSDPTADSQIVKLKTAGADVFVDLTSPRFAALAIRKVAELGWKPMHFLSSVSGSIGSVLQPAGLENAKGVLSTAYTKDPSDPLWNNDPGMIKWNAFMDKYMPGANKADQGHVSSYMATQTLVEVLRRCGDDLSRENIMRQAASLRDLEVDVLLPGIKVNTSPTDFYPVEQMQMRRFDGRVWELFGPVINGEVGSPAG